MVRCRMFTGIQNETSKVPHYFKGERLSAKLQIKEWLLFKFLKNGNHIVDKFFSRQFFLLLKMETVNP